MVDEEMPAAASPVSSTEEAVTLSPKRKLVESPVPDSSDKVVKAAPPSLNSVADLTKLKTLADFGYAFNDKGEMRSISTGEAFNFQVKPGDQHFNQKHYEALGEVVTEEVYKLLESRAGLEKRYLDKQKRSFVFVSPDYQNKEFVVCLIHGSGVVRAGQWARKLIINNDLEKGTQIPYIQRCTQAGYGVVVFNTNQNSFIDKKGKKVVLAGSEDPEDHAITVWNQLISRENNIKKIVVVAHSYGGVVTMSLARQMRADFMERVTGIFMTDSVHYQLTGSQALDARLQKIGINYVASQLELGEPVKSRKKDDVPCVSAGHEQHEWTSCSAIESIFQDIAKAFDSTPTEEPKSEL